MRLRSKRWFFIAWLAIFLPVNLAWPQMSWAQDDFDYNYIISDHDMTDYQAMSLEQIQSFLLSKNSILASYIDPITAMRAAQVIYLSAQDFQISPKFLLALLQKEQSLVEHPSPRSTQYDWATGYAVCDSCRTDDPALQRFKGFYNQVYNAAKQFRNFYLSDLQTKGFTLSGYAPGVTKLVNGLPVTPVNNATAALYTYTPHLHGNRLLAQVWQRFFARSYPDGTLLNIEGEREVWLIQDGFRRMFANRSVYLSRYSDFQRVLTVSRADLIKYAEGREIKFPNYAYLRTPRGTVYLLVDDELRGFASAEALRRIGVNPEEIIDVAQDDINEYSEGQPITVGSLYPLGALWQDKRTGGVYWVQDGVKYPIWSREVMKVNFGNRQIISKATDELATFVTGEPVMFREGELVKAQDDPAVYLISNRQRRPFQSAEVFEALGFNWQSVVVTAPAAVLLHPVGEPIVANF